MSKKPEKPKTRKVPAATCISPKLTEAQRDLWGAINLMKMINLTATEAIERDAREAEEFLNAISTAAEHAIDRIDRAYNLIDEAESAFAISP
jgi:hypothetical protein